jgi:UDPglucose--hexose-1-phosphate uridylyltransferase
VAQARTTDLGDVVYVAPERRKRPRGEQPSGCPFCAGNESMTPPTVQQVPAEGDWKARAFVNRFPITERHEVVVDAPRHVLTFADLEPAEALAALGLYRDRAAALASEGIHYLLFRNEGPGAGASIPHSHAQIVGESRPFPRQEARRRPAEDVPVREGRGARLAVPAVSRMPYELWLAPNDATTAFHEADAPLLADVAPLFLAASQGIRGLAGSKGWNVVLQTGNSGWRFEFLPRTETMAGLELGAMVWVNSVEADEAARWWRERLRA